MKGNVIGYVKVLEMLPRKKLITSKADWILGSNAKKAAQVCSKGWEPRQAEESWCYISRNGELEREVDQAEPGEDAHGQEGSQTRNGQRRSRKP